MSLNLTNAAYPIDYTGNVAANKVTGEQQALTGGANSNFYFVVPDFAPYFEASLKIFYRAVSGETRQLVNGIDFYPTHFFISASRACGKEIYGSVTFFDLGLNGTIILEYQTLGGTWTQSSNTIAAILADRLNNPRETVWEQVVNMPGLFPVVDHAWNLVDMVGMSFVVTALNEITEAILSTASAVALSHLNNVDNPHRVTAAQIGAVTTVQLNAAILAKMQELGGGNTNTLTEGHTNLFFTTERVRNTPLDGIDLQNAVNRSITPQDSVEDAFATLQAQIVTANQEIAKRVITAMPITSGPSITNLRTVEGVDAATVIKVALAGAHKVIVKANTSIQFDTTGMPNLTGKIVEFALTLQNDGTAGRGVSFPLNIRWAGGAIPPRTTTAAAVDEYYFFSADNMVTWTGSLSNLDTR